MNRLLIIPTILIILLFQGIMSPKLKAAELQEIRLKSDELCNVCKLRLEKFFKIKAGVVDNYIDVDSKMVFVMFDPDMVKRQEIQASLEKLGFKMELLNFQAEKLNAAKEKNKSKSNNTDVKG